MLQRQYYTWMGINVSNPLLEGTHSLVTPRQQAPSLTSMPRRYVDVAVDNLVSNYKEFLGKYELSAVRFIELYGCMELWPYDEHRFRISVICNTPSAKPISYAEKFVTQNIALLADNFSDAVRNRLRHEYKEEADAGTMYDDEL